jgi:MFS family permease
MAQAGSRSFTDLAILRTLSGAAEATADPAFVLITAMWYTRAQQPRRIAYWYCANGIGIALGGLLGYGIGHVCIFKYTCGVHNNMLSDTRTFTLEVRISDNRRSLYRVVRCVVVPCARFALSLA